jgi:hypothetical protein
VTNIHNVASPHWRRWLGVDSRCVIPFSSFSENEILPDGSRPPVWFAFVESRALALFAGLWTRRTSVRKVDVCPQGQGRRDDERPLRLSDDGAERRGQGDPPQGNAGHSDDTGRGRDLADRADEEAMALQRPLPDERCS